MKEVNQEFDAKMQKTIEVVFLPEHRVPHGDGLLQRPGRAGQRRRTG